ncbi:unnamed protein product [Cuscuta epithymum]|uniref:Uncharacterized protein n=1 Tax=Cuscuta epithymum TaxID=186058 RepID=A0AAV0FGG7_9ASTE|nr:unnamed protein product [Cuscuta epithymum]
MKILDFIDSCVQSSFYIIAILLKKASSRSSILLFPPLDRKIDLRHWLLNFSVVSVNSIYGISSSASPSFRPENSSTPQLRTNQISQLRTNQIAFQFSSLNSSLEQIDC